MVNRYVHSADRFLYWWYCTALLGSASFNEYASLIDQLMVTNPNVIDYDSLANPTCDLRAFQYSTRSDICWYW